MKKRASIPSWFNLNNYEHLKSMNRGQWRNIWLLRRNAYNYLKHKEDKLLYINKEDISRFSLNLEFTPDSLFNSQDAINKISESSIFFLYQIAKTKGNNEFIKTLDNLSEYIDQHKAKNTYTESIIDDVSIYDYIELDLDNSEMINEINNHFGLLISVETNLSDEVIIEQFKKVLAEHREKTKNNGKIISDTEISNIIEYKVIPYIDLMLWSMATGEKFRDQEIADTLFPDEYDISRIDTVRQTVKKRALRLLSSSSPKFI